MHLVLYPPAGMELKRIPLFPLEVVLFPGMPLPLHIFEPRYKLLTRRCLEERTEFGVVLARSEGIASVGCTTEIVKVVHEYPDGRMDILTAGRKRYRITSVFEEKPYLEGDVEYLVDNVAPPRASSRLLELYEQCYGLLFGQPTETPPSGAEASLAFHIAGVLPLDLEIKQAILEMPAEEERQRHLAEQLGTWLPQLTHLSRVRKRAGGNGSAVN